MTLVALGDSVATGVGAPDPQTEGYVPVLARLLAPALGCAADCSGQVSDLAVPGATTATLLRDQLPRALALLGPRSPVRLVTVTVGGNDVFLPVLRSCGPSPQAPACRAEATAAIGAVGARVGELLTALDAALPAGAVVAVMAYYDPLPACRLAPLSPLAQQVLEGSGAAPGLNDVLRRRAAEHGAVVVETAGRLRIPDDFVGGSDCLHPSGSGHARVARAFRDAVQDRLPGPGQR